MSGNVLIINADDFGQDSVVNRAIVKSFKDGYVQAPV